MNRLLKEELMKETLAIGDEVIANAISEGNQCFWNTLDWEKKGNGILEPSYKTTIPIYGGVAGVIYFLLELYKETKIKKYKEFVLKGAAWISSYCEENSIANYNIYHGITGVSIILLEVYKLTGEKKFYDASIRLLKIQEINYEHLQVSDLLSGNAGTIIGLLKMHAETSEEFILKIINNVTSTFLSDINLGKKGGIFWDRFWGHIDGLCGFSHGNAGIGFMLLELGRYFGNEAFFLLAEQAFLYEDSLFNKRTGNWPDLRPLNLEGKPDTFKNFVMKGNYSPFFIRGNMTAWCHGSPGIGLSRIRAFEVIRKTKYWNSVEIAINNIVKFQKQELQNPFQSHCLCHGINGNAIFLLEVFRRSRNQNLLSTVELAARACLDYKKRFGHYYFRKEKNTENNLGFFMGKSGVGYFYLRCLNPVESNYILYCYRKANMWLFRKIGMHRKWKIGMHDFVSKLI